ncbi:MAG TPA: O-antigen ligase family protein [Sphingomicrobium sp.]|nr:O-antigen ligase family protein [Sphingomicrobium sp.]
MKWIFIAGLLVLIPAMVGMLRAHPQYRLYAAFLIGLLPFIIVPYLTVAPISWAMWPGPVKGVEVSLLDAVALAVLFSTPAFRTPLALKVSCGIITLALFISTSTGYQTVPALFYAWQLLRMVVVFLAVSRLCASVPEAPIALLAGAGLGLTYEAGLAVYQYLGGNPRPGGNLGHSNFLGLASDFVVFPTLALLMGGKRFWWPAIVVFAGLTIAVVGGSRATLGLFGIGSVLTVILSLRHHRTSKKFGFAGLAAFAMLVAAPVIIWGADRRSESEKISSDLDRAAMTAAASMMIGEHPLGVGADQYVIVANSGGYSDRANVPWDAGDRSAPVHNFYYLITAELGFVGLIGFLTILASLLGNAFRALGRPIKERTSELIPGLAAMLVVVIVHISFEWVFMQFVLQYLFAISAGVLIPVAARSNALSKVSRSRPISHQAVAQAG